MTRHDLKIAPAYFDAVRNGIKKAEVRIDDRDYMVGDTLHLRESDDVDQYTGRYVDAVITHILRHEDFPDGIAPGYAVLSIEVVG